MENITKTFNSYNYTCVAYNRDTKAMETKTVMLNKQHELDNALKIIAKKYNSDTITYADVVEVTPVAEKRIMSVETFMNYAKQLEKPNPQLVTRTIKQTTYTCVVYLKSKKIMDTATFTLDKEIDNDKALKQLCKRYNGDTLTVVDVLGKDTTEILYGITPEEFIAHSKVVEDSKEG